MQQTPLSTRRQIQEQLPPVARKGAKREAPSLRGEAALHAGTQTRPVDSP